MVSLLHGGMLFASGCSQWTNHANLPDRPLKNRAVNLKGNGDDGNGGKAVVDVGNHSVVYTTSAEKKARLQKMAQEIEGLPRLAQGDCRFKALKPTCEKLLTVLKAPVKVVEVAEQEKVEAAIHALENIVDLLGEERKGIRKSRDDLLSKFAEKMTPIGNAKAQGLNNAYLEQEEAYEAIGIQMDGINACSKIFLKKVDDAVEKARKALGKIIY